SDRSAGWHLARVPQPLHHLHRLHEPQLDHVRRIGGGRRSRLPVRAGRGSRARYRSALGTGLRRDQLGDRQVHRAGRRRVRDGAGASEPERAGQGMDRAGRLLALEAAAPAALPVPGFKRAAEGTLLLDGEEIGRLSATRRARAGIGRSFQSLELFEDSTVLANLRSASDPHDVFSYLGDLVYPRDLQLTGEMVSVIKEFRLEGDLDRIVENLP